jgi:hypothetical protein
MTHEQYLNLERSFIGIRDERNFRANTATRIGTAFLELLRNIRTGEFDEVSFNSVSNKPSFIQGLYTYGSIILDGYIQGLQGGIITEEGFAELKDLWVREHARIGDGSIHHDAAGRPLPALEVDGDAVFSGNLSSPEFISGFLSGLGWAIQKKEFVNSAGVTETKYSLEIDNLTVRNTLRVFEMIISQLRGENDNYVFAAMMEVDHYDPMTGKVWLSTNGGKSYMNFRKGDYIMVQRFQPGNDAKSGGDGYVVKSYELVVYAVGSGGENDPKDENGDRLDWVLFKNFTTQMVYDEEDPGHRDVDYVGTYHTEEEIGGMADPVFMGPEMLIAKGDTFCRIDNETDPERKGLMTITSVGPNTPYMDIMYGRKTDPKHALKSRIGNLEGIRTEQFGWLQGFGAYINNLYAVGNLFNAQTGEHYESRIEATRESMRMLYRETLYDISEGDNKISNGFFQKGLDDWSLVDCEGYALPDEPEVDCGEKYTDPETGRETVDWFLKDATGEEDADGMTVSDGTMVEVDGGELGVPLLINGQVIQQKRLVAELKTVEGVQVLHVCNAGVAQDFSVVKPNSAHKKLSVDDDEFENPSSQVNEQPDYEKTTYRYWEDQYRDWLIDEYDYDDWRIEEILCSATAINWINGQVATWTAFFDSQVDHLTATEDEVDKLYFGIRILPLTDGVLRVGFLRDGEYWSESSGFSETLIASNSWELRQACDYPEDGRAWYFPLDTDDVVKEGRLVVSFSGECYIRFVAVSSDPISEAEREYRTLFEQNSRRIRMQASKDEQEYADWTIQYNAIAQRVTDNRNLADRALKDILGIEYDEDSGTYVFPDDWVNPNYTYASWIIHTKNRLDFLFTKWDDDSNLVGYSDRAQTADYIRQVIAGTANDPLWGTEGQALVAAFNSFKQAWDTALADGVIDARERASLDELKKAMATAFSQANAFYDKALVNPIMGNTDELADLRTKWSTLSGKYTALVAAIDAVLAVNGNIDVNGTHQNLVNAVESAYTDFNSALSAFYQSLAVANNYVDGELANRVKAVQDNLTGFQQSLDREIQKAFPDKTFINWLSDTKTSSMQVLGMISVDSNGNPILTDYSLKTQTATAIEEAVSSSELYARNQVNALKDLIHSDVLKNNGAWSYATFKSETADQFSDIAGRFTVGGTLRSLSWMKQYADGIETTVKSYSDSGIDAAETSLKQYADNILVEAKNYANGKVSTLGVTVDGIAGRVSNIESSSIISQTANTIKGVVTSSYISSTIGLSDYAKKNQLPDMTNYYTKSDFEMTPSQIKQRVEGLETTVSGIAFEWEQGSFPGSYTTGGHYESMKTSNNKAIRTVGLIPINVGNSPKFYVNKGFTLIVAFFSSSGGFLGSISGTCNDKNLVNKSIPSAASSATQCAVSIVYGSALTPAQAASAGFRIANSVVVTSAEITAFVTEDDVGNMISVAQISADKIINLSSSWETWTSTYKVKADDITWNFSKAASWVANNKTVMTLDTSGNLSITGTLSQNSVINPSAKVDGIKAGTTMLNYKAQYKAIPSGSTDMTVALTWDGGSTIILYGSHSSGNVYVRLPSQSSIRSTLGISSGNFVVELNIINLSSYAHLYLSYSSSNGVDTSYPRMMNWDNGAWSGGDTNMQLAVGDFVKILLVYNNSYYNAYTIIHRDHGGLADDWEDPS